MAGETCPWLCLGRPNSLPNTPTPSEEARIRNSEGKEQLSEKPYQST